MKKLAVMLLAVAFILALVGVADESAAAEPAHFLTGILPVGERLEGVDLSNPLALGFEYPLPARGPPKGLAPLLTPLRATRTWSAAADANWSAVSSWDGGVSVPSTTDAIVFSNTSVKNCTIDNLGTWSGGTFTIQSTYSGTITQSSGINITTAAYSQAAGTFTCNAAATFTSTTFAMTAGTFNQGGAFTSTSFTANTGSPAFAGSSSTMTSTGTVTLGNTAAVTATSGTWNVGAWAQSGTTTFTHNSGTLNLTGTSVAITDTRSTFNKWTINAGGAATISASTVVPLGATPTSTTVAATLTIAGTVTWSGAWSHTGSISTSNGSTLTGTGTPTITLNLSLTITNVTTITNAIGTVTFNSNGSTTITDTSDLLSGTTYAVNKTGAGTLTIAASTNARFGASPTITMGSGAITVNGTLTWSSLLTLTTTGGTTTANGSTLAGSGSPTISMVGSLTITATTTVSTAIATVTFTSTGGPTITDTGDALSGTTYVFSKASGTPVVAASTTVRLGLNPTLGCGGFTVTGTLSGTGTLTWTTTTAGSTFTLSASAVVSGFTAFNMSGNVTLNAGTWPTTANLTASGGTSNTTVTDTGGLSTGTWTVNKSGSVNFTIAASTTCRFGANPTLTLGTGVFTVTGTMTWSGNAVSTTTASFTVGSGATVTATSSPTLSVSGALNFNSAATLTNAIPTITLTGGGGTLTDTGDKLSGTTYVINAPSAVAAMTVAASTIMRIGSSPTTTLSTGVNLTVTGTISGTGAWTHTGNILVSSGGVVSGFSSLSLPGNLNVNAAGTFPTIPLSFTASGAVSSTLAGTTATFGTVSIDKGAFPSPIFAVAANTICPLGANPSTRATWTSVSGTVTWTGTWTNEDDINVTSGGTISGGTAIRITNGGIGFFGTAVFPASLNITFSYDGAANGTNFTFAGGSNATFGAIQRTGVGTSTITITGSNAFSSFRDNDALVAHTLKFTAGTTQTIAASPSQYMIDGGASNTVTIASTSGGSGYTLAFPTGGKPINLRNCAITDLTTTGSEVWAGPACTGTASGTLKIAINPRLRKQLRPTYIRPRAA